MTEETAAIEIRDLSFAYDDIQILCNVRLDIWRGDSICIVGPNGGGKTTLIKLILGLLSPDRGIIRIFGRSPEAERQRIGYVPQYAKYDPQFPISVLDVVMMGRLAGTLRNRYSPEDRDQAMAALGQTGLTDLAARPFASISGGQRQRTLIARALASGRRHPDPRRTDGQYRPRIGGPVPRPAERAQRADDDPDGDPRGRFRLEFFQAHRLRQPPGRDPSDQSIDRPADPGDVRR